MTAEVYAWLFKFTIILAIAGAVFAFGYHTAESKLRPEITKLEASLLVIDLKAKADEQFYKRNLDEINKQAKRDRAAIDNYYAKRVLSQTPDNNGSSKTPHNTAGVGTAPGQPATTGLDFEKKCVEDALKLSEIGEFFRANKFPTED